MSTYTYTPGYEGSGWPYSGVQPADVVAYYAAIGVEWPPITDASRVNSSNVQDYPKRNLMVEQFIADYLGGGPGGYTPYTGDRGGSGSIPLDLVPVPAPVPAPALVLVDNSVYSDLAIKGVRDFLNRNYPLPSGWLYDVQAIAGKKQCAINAQAVSSDPRRVRVPAGTITADPMLYDSGETVWQDLGMRFFDFAKPVYMNTIAQCLASDAAANLEQFVAGSAEPPTTAETIGSTSVPVVSIPGASQGVNSDGQNPWDAQPDVVSRNQPTVQGTNMDAGYTASTGAFPPGFLSWFNLKVPDADQVAIVVASGDLLQGYIDQFNAEQAKALSIVATAPPGFTSWFSLKVPDADQVALIVASGDLLQVYIDQFNAEQRASGAAPISSAWPIVQLPDPIKTVPSMPIDDGTGTWPLSAGTSTTKQVEQKEPVNLETVKATVPASDAVDMMLRQTGTDYLNMLGEQYSETLKTVSTNTQARVKADVLAAQGNLAGLENFLRNFSAADYTVKPPGVPDTVVTSPSNDKTILIIGLGLLALVALVGAGKIKL